MEPLFSALSVCGRTSQALRHWPGPLAVSLSCVLCSDDGRSHAGPGACAVTPGSRGCHLVVSELQVRSLRECTELTGSLWGDGHTALCKALAPTSELQADGPPGRGLVGALRTGGRAGWAWPKGQEGVLGGRGVFSRGRGSSPQEAVPGGRGVARAGRRLCRVGGAFPSPWAWTKLTGGRARWAGRFLPMGVAPTHRRPCRVGGAFPSPRAPSSQLPGEGTHVGPMRSH